MSAELEGIPLVLLRWKTYGAMWHETIQNPELQSFVRVSWYPPSYYRHLALLDMGAPLLTWLMQHCAPPILLVDGYCKRMGLSHEAHMSDLQDGQSA